MPRNCQGNKSEANANPNAGASETDDANKDSQKAVLLAIQSLRQGLMAKIEEKATAQLAVLQSQMSWIQTELLCVVEKVHKRVKATESQMLELDVTNICVSC